MTEQQTSPSLAAYIEKMARAEEDGEGAVVLEPTLSYGFGLFSLRVAVRGPRGAYVVRSIGQFADSLRSMAEVRYGSKLSFVHRVSAFAAASQPLLGFIDRAVEARRAAAAPRSGRAGRPWEGPRGATVERGEVAGRSLALTEAEAVTFLDAVGEAPFAFECTDGSVRSRMTVRVAAGDPPAVLRIIEEEDGVRLMRDDALVGAFSGDAAYVLLDDVFYRTTPAFADGADFLRAVYHGDDRSLFVGPDDLAAFGASVLPRLEAAFEVEAPALLDRYRRVPCRLRFHFDRVGDGIEVSAWARYGAVSVPLALAPSDMAAAMEAAPAGAVVLAGVADEPPESALDRACRDRACEEAALALLRAYLPPTAVLSLDAEEAVGALLFQGLAAFAALGEVLTTPAFDRLLFDGVPRVSLGLSLAGDLIAMDVTPADIGAEELAALLGSYRRHRRFHRLRSGAFARLEGEDLARLDRLCADLGIDPAAVATGRVELPTYQALYLDNELDDAYREGAFAAFVERFRAMKDAPVPPAGETASPGVASEDDGAALRGVLRPYQAAGVAWIDRLWEFGFGGILADEMGLGKSLQVIAALVNRRAAEVPGAPSLIICPASLVYNWEAEFEKFAPGLPVTVVAGTAAERKRLREQLLAGGKGNGGANCSRSEGAGRGSRADSAANETVQWTVSPSEDCLSTTPLPAPSDRTDAMAPDAPIFITSYDLLRQDAEAWQALALDVVVLDEAHYIKNHATLTTRAVKRLRCARRLALTGTPLENKLSEMWSLFDFLMSGFLGPYQGFRERFEAAIIGGDDDAARRLRLLASPFVLRRTKAEVAPSLPEKTTTVVPVALEGEQRRLYDGAEQSLRERLAAQIRLSRSRAAKQMSAREREAAAPSVPMLAELTALRRLALDPALVFENYRGEAAKMEALSDLVAHGVGAGQRILVFSQFTSFLDRVAERLRAEGVGFFMLTGATPKRERLRLAEAFNAGGAPVFLISLKAGGVGLNLTGATMVVHTDPWWNAAATDQATDRTHRIGQTAPVSVYELVATGTIEERIRALQDAKRALAALVLGDEAPAGPQDSAESLTAEELWELLGG